MSNEEENLKNQIRSLKSIGMGDFDDDEEIEESNPSIDRSEFENSYIIKGEIGSGGLKSIHKVRDRRTGREVAMAKLKEELRTTKNIERFLREARILASLEHTNIVPIYEINYDREDCLFFTMKLLSGQTLSNILREIRNENSTYIERYPLQELLNIFIRVCDAITYAHSKQTVHLDLKPENIQISEFGEVSVIDWGMAKIIGDAESLMYEDTDMVSFTPVSTNPTMVGTVSGTPGYMSPEQSEIGEITPEIPSDIYSLGATLYTIIYHKHAYHGLESEVAIQKTRDGIPPEFPEKVDGKTIPSALRAIAKKAMMPNINDRYQNVRELRNDIVLYQNDFSTHAEDIGISKILFLFVKRHYAATVSSLIVLLLIAALGYFSLASIQERDKKLEATADEVVFGTLEKESQLRYELKFDELIKDYTRLIQVGYNDPVFKFKLAMLHAGNFELRKSAQYLNEISRSNSDIKNKESFKMLKENVEEYLSENLSEKDSGILVKFLETFPNRNELTIIKAHGFHTIYRHKINSLDKNLNNLKDHLLAINISFKGDMNYHHSIKNGDLSVDLSNNPHLRHIQPLLFVPVNHLNVSNTSMGLADYSLYSSVQESLETLIVNDYKFIFSQGVLDRLKLKKLVIKNARFEATNLRDDPYIRHLDVEGCDFSDIHWSASRTLEYLNIANSNFFDFEKLRQFKSLKTLVIDDSMTIPVAAGRVFKRAGTKIIIKEKRK